MSLQHWRDMRQGFPNAVLAKTQIVCSIRDRKVGIPTRGRPTEVVGRERGN